MESEKLDRRSIGDLLKELAHESRMLFRQEVALVKAETREKLKVLGRNLAFVGVGVVIGLLAVLALLTAVICGLIVLLVEVGLTLGTSLWLAPLLVALVIGVVAYVLIQKGLSTLRNEGVTPQHTKETLQEHTAWMREKLT